MSGFALFFYIDVSKQKTIELNTTNLAVFKSSYNNMNTVLEILG